MFIDKRLIKQATTYRRLGPSAGLGGFFGPSAGLGGGAFFVGSITGEFTGCVSETGLNPGLLCFDTLL